MFVIAADQRASRTTGDLVSQWRDLINDGYGTRLALPADRNAGDEIQVLSADAATVLDIALRLSRSGTWSIGLGVGPVRQPLPSETREASGPAFASASDAVTAAKKRPTRFAVRADEKTPDVWPSGHDAQNLIDPLLELRRKRSPQGWELYDTMASTSTQAQAAQRLGITAAAASDRALAASLKIERAAIPAIVRLLEALDTASGSDRQD